MLEWLKAQNGTLGATAALSVKAVIPTWARCDDASIYTAVSSDIVRREAIRCSVGEVGDAAREEQGRIDAPSGDESAEPAVPFVTGQEEAEEQD